MIFNFFKSRPSINRHNAGSKHRTKHAQDKKNRIEKISVDRLRIGMYVRELDIPWEKSSFMFQGIDVKTQGDILEVQKQCQFVWVDYIEYLLSDSKPESSNNAFDSKISNLQLEEEYDEAKIEHDKAKKMVVRMFSDIRLGKGIDVEEVKKSISSSVDMVLRNPDASIWLTRLQAKDNLTAQHSLNVTALSIITGRSLGMSKSELESLGTCALLHDVGKTLLPSELINKNGPLTEPEKALMRTHPQLGYDILTGSGSTNISAAKVALYHHERADGSGYPRGLKADKIPHFAKIVAIADAYDVMTTRQIYRDVLSPTETLDVLYSGRGTQFDEDLVLKFIDGIGIFPPGSIVEMTNGEVGIVLSTTKDKLKPRIIMILNQIKDAAVQQVIDLSQICVDLGGLPYQIKTTLRDGAFGIYVNDFQRAGLRIG